MTILCYHHKGGVGKSTTAVHVVLGLLPNGRSVLAVDGDTQAHTCSFFDVPPTSAEDGAVAVAVPAGTLHVVHAAYRDLRRAPRRVGADDTVIDLSADFEQMARVATTLPPDLVLLCTKPHAGALRDLSAVVNALVRETDAEVRIVPIGMDEAAIRAELAAFPAGAYVVTEPVSYVPNEAERSFTERRPVWELPGCEAMHAQYDALTDP